MNGLLTYGSHSRLGGSVTGMECKVGLSTASSNGAPLHPVMTVTPSKEPDANGVCGLCRGQGTPILGVLADAAESQICALTRAFTTLLDLDNDT